MRQSCLMTEELQDIKTLIEQGDTERAIHALTNFIRNDAHVNDEPYYLLVTPTAKWETGNKL